MFIVVLFCARSWATAPSPPDPSVPAGLGMRPPTDSAGEEVVIEGRGGGATDPGATSASVTVVEVDARLAASADVATVLDRSAGTAVVHLGGLGDWSAVSIRGSSLRQVQVFLDGVPLNPDGSDVVNLSELPLQAFQRIELFRGSAPPAYGASPIGGVVDLVTAPEPPPSFALSAGQHGTARSFAMDGFRGDLAGRPLDGLLIADLFHTRGDFAYFDDNGSIYLPTDDRLLRRENNDKSQLSTIGRLRLGDGALRFSLQDAFLGREEGLPGQANLPTEAARLATLRNLAVATVEGAGGRRRLSGRLWLLQRQETLDDRGGELGIGGGQWTRSWTRHAGLDLGARLVARPWLLPSAHLALRREDYVEAWLQDDLVEHPRVRWSGTAALAADLRLVRDRVVLSPVLQGQWIDNRSLGTVPFSELPVAPDEAAQLLVATPRLGLLLRPWIGQDGAGLSLKANAGRSLRPPDLTELFGDRGVSVGNSALRAERGLSADLGARLQWAGEGRARPGRGGVGSVSGSLDLAHFWTRTEDLIVMVQNAQGTGMPVNLGLAWVQGLEGALALDLWGLVDSEGSLTWTLSRNLTADPSVANKQLPRIPTWELSQATSLHWQERLRLGHTWSWTDGNYWDATNFYRAAPRPLHGAFLRLQPDPAWPSLELSVLNLLDSFVQVVDRNPLDETDEARIVDAISDYAGYPLPGRTWMASLRWSPRPPVPTPPGALP